MIQSRGLEILEKIEAAGFEAYFVGGSVRDHLLGREPKDIDIATSATPDFIEGLFLKTIPTGKEYGTITVVLGGECFEVTTFRLELDYDGRRPKTIAFTTSLVEDLSRRDFTINAMAMDLRGQLYDPFGGQVDLKAGILRFVGSAQNRIEEDKLRVLRYVRFLTTYRLKSDPEALAQLVGVDIGKLSVERIREEFNKILLSENVKMGVALLEDLGLLNQIIPEFSRCKGFLQHHPAHSQDVFDHTLAVVEACEKNLEVRLAALCHDLGKIETLTFDEKGCGHFYGHAKVSAILAETVLKRLKYSKDLIQTVVLLVENHMKIYENTSSASAKRLIRALGVERLGLFFDLQTADTLSCNGDRSVFVTQIKAMNQACEDVLLKEEAFKVTDLSIGGKELLELGFQGPSIGRTLNYLLELVIEEKLENEKSQLLGAAKQFWIDNGM